LLTDPKLRSQVDQLWDKLWTGGLTNPMDAIEQLSYLIFLKRLDDEEDRREKQARLRGETYGPRLPEELRWRHWTHFQADQALQHVKDEVFPWFRKMGQAGSSFERYMQNAEFKINKPSLIIEACKTIDHMHISAQNQDVQGDLYEYLLSYLNIAGRNGWVTWRPAPAASWSTPTSISWKATPLPRCWNTTPRASPTTWWATG
jgi:type I restriction enzyme M protein